MGSRLTKEILQGILVPDERVTLDNIHSGSSYTEQGPRPGVPVPDNAASTLRPVVTSSQTANVRAGIVRAGGVGAAEIAYKLDSEGASSWRGYSYPSAVVYCDVWSEDHVASNGLRWFDCATDPNTQDVYAAYTNQDGALRFVRWNAQTWEPGSTVVIDADASVGTDEQRGVAVQVQPTGRIVVWAGVLSYYSDDGGTTWADYAVGAYATAGNPVGMEGPQRVIRVGGDYMSIQLVDDGVTATGDQAYQYASTDQGQTWRAVGGVFGFGRDLDAAELPDGSAWIVYIDDTTGFCRALKVTGAFESVEDAMSSSLLVGSNRPDAVSIAIDPNGAAYIFYRYDERIIGHELIDGAWVEMTTGGANFKAETNAPTKIAACMSNGAVAMISDAKPAAGRPSDNKQLRGMLWGGYSTLVADHNGNQIDAPGFDNDRAAVVYQPIATPDAAGAWTAGGSSGSATITAEGLSINGADKYYSLVFHPSTNGAGVTCQWSLKVSTADASGTDPVPGLELTQHDGSGDQSTISVIYRTNEIEIYDVLAASVLTTITVDTTADRIYSLSMNKTGAIVFGSRLKGETVWSITTTTASTATATASAGSVAWGHIGGSVSRASIWQFVQARFVADTYGPYYWVYGQADLVGRVLNGIPTPCPVVGDDGTQVAYLHAEGGDAPDQAAYTIDAAHDYPVEAMLPQVSPSPSVDWRSTSTAEQAIAWDLGSTNTDRSYMGKAIGLYLDGCNFRTCELEGSLDGLAWTTIQSVDMASGMSAAIPYTLAGDVITFGAGQADRYLFGEMLRGSHVIIAAGESTVSRKIAANLSGAISASGTTSRPALRLEALDGTESASGTCVIVSKRALSVSYDTALQTYRYWRVRIPAGQDICGLGSDPETGYRIGSLVLGEWMAYGGGTGIGWTEAAAPNYAETVSRRGTRYRKSYGPPARRWSLVWDEADRFLDDTTPDYVANDGTDQPLAARAEIYEQLRAIAIRTGALSVPVVASRYVPAATGTTVWPSTMLYGHISGEVELQQVTGDNDWSAQQVIRAGNIQIDEVI